MQSWDFFVCARVQGNKMAGLWWCREGFRWVWLEAGERHELAAAAQRELCCDSRHKRNRGGRVGDKSAVLIPDKGEKYVY
jgi:hypothetical protein